MHILLFGLQVFADTLSHLSHVTNLLTSLFIVEKTEIQSLEVICLKFLN